MAASCLKTRQLFKERFTKSRLKILQFPFVKKELFELDARLEILSNEHRNECIDLHTKTFINGNSVSKLFNINENNKLDFDDCNLISKTRVDHAILTGLSIVIINNKNNKIMVMIICFDDCDLPTSMKTEEYKSEAVKLRQTLTNQIEHNDSHLQKIRSDSFRNDNNNNNNNSNFGKIVYGCYRCKQYKNNIRSVVDNSYILASLTHDLIFIDIGYNHVYALQTHKKTVKSTNLLTQYCDSNPEWNGISAVSSELSYQSFEKYIKSMNKSLSMSIDNNNSNNINNNNNKSKNNNYKYDKEDLVLLLAFMDFQFFKNKNWNLKQIWKWRKYELPKYIISRIENSKQEKTQIKSKL